MAITNKLYRPAFVIMLFFSFIHLGCSKGSTSVEKDPSEPTKPDITLVNGNDVYGYVLDETKKPIADVSVSDGFTVVKTDAKGIYQFKKNVNSKFVYYSTPSTYEIHVESPNRQVALFYKALTQNSPQQVDFTLTRRKNKVDNYTLFGIGDPQVANDSDVERFTNETLQDIKTEVAKIPGEVYGLSLGDVVADKPGLLNTMKIKLGSNKMKVFTTIGNHDKTFTTQRKTSDVFENIFGPTNYSFEIGQVHYICLDNVVFEDNSSYGLGINQHQINWMKQDLAQVSKEKMLIIYYHMPIRGSNFATRDQFFELIKDYKEVHLFSGHTHYAENYIHAASSKTIYEHVHAATCGAWWKSTINGDGTPNGYMIYQIEGATIKNWIYKPTNRSKDFQLRLHWGDMSFGGQYGYFTYGQPGNTLVANVWNADPQWKVEVYMDDKKIGDMVKQSASPLNQDAWSKGFHLGVLNRNPSNYSTSTKHLYTYKIDSPNNSLKVIVTDRFGKTYEQTEITTDFSSALGY